MKITKETYKKAFERLWLSYSYGKINFKQFLNRLSTLNRYISIVLFLLFFTPSAFSEVIDIPRLADSIYKAENSIKYPYGIKSINTRGNKIYARKICINTIKNNIRRYNKSHKNIDYITFLGNRYCPIGAKDDPKGLNNNWINNVKYYYYKKGK